MKDFFVGWTVRGGIVLVVALCTLWGGAGSAWASGKTAQVMVGFTGAPPPGFQNVLLNVQAVRINPHANAGPSTGGWQIIPTPPGIGGGNQNAVLQIDLNKSQDLPEIFNGAKVRPGTYKVAQILLDPNNPGTLIPNCPQIPAGPEGCINYPFVLTNGQVITAILSGVAPSNSTITPLIFQVQLMINNIPIVTGGAYQATLQLTQTTAALGTVMGSIPVPTGSSSGSTGNLSKLTVTAETIGTNTAISSALINKTKRTYTLVLPAAAGFGTLYDLAVAGGGDSFSAARLPPLFPNGMINGPTFNVSGQALGNITGMVTDGCSKNNSTPIVGATLQLLIPPVSSPGFDCSASLAAAAQCVTVASANTDDAGNFPLPGSLTTPAQFQNVPTLPKGAAYAMEVTAAGYDPLLVQVKPSLSAGKSGGGTCETMGSTSFTKCNLAMTSQTITGTIPITPPIPGQTISVQVFAEPSGTNNIQSSLPMPITVRNPNASFKYTLKVPSTTTMFDLFATTVDKFQGVTDPYQGHSIVVLSGVTTPMPPMACATTTADFDPTVFIDCVGHGSLIGSTGNANLGASIALSKLDPVSGNPVQITTAQIQNISSMSSTSNYAFCAPGDTYELQPVQLPEPVADAIPAVVPSPALTGDPVMVTIPPAPIVNGPTPTPSPSASGSPTPTPSAIPTAKITCPTTCSITNNSCPGTCNTLLVTPPIPIPPPPTLPIITATPTATATP